MLVPIKKSFRLTVISILFFSTVGCGSSSTLSRPKGTIVTFPVTAGVWALAVDSAGNVWVACNGAACTSNGVTIGITELTASSGYLTQNQVQTYFSPYDIAIDGYNNIWLTPSSSIDSVEEVYNETTIYTYNTPQSPANVAIDISGNIWITNNGTANSVTELNSNGGIVNSTISVGSDPIAIATDGSNNIWVANDGTTASPGTTITKLTGSGSTIGSFNSGGTSPVGIAMDPSGNAWVTNYTSNNVAEISPSGQTIGSFPISHNPEGIAIDSAGNVFIASFTSNTVTEIPFINSTYSSSNEIKYTVGKGPYGIAIDAGGNVWVANTTDSTVSEIVGVAAPTKTPTIGLPAS